MGAIELNGGRIASVRKSDARTCGIYDEAVVRLDEIKMIFAKDGHIGIQRVLGHHPLDQAA